MALGKVLIDPLTAGHGRHQSLSRVHSGALVKSRLFLKPSDILPVGGVVVHGFLVVAAFTAHITASS